MKQDTIDRMALSAMFLALAFVLPFVTGQIPQVGAMLCPMHIPVLLCGFVCGWSWGLTAGFAAPFLRSVILGAPPLFPTAVCMSFELAAYGAVSGIVYRALPEKKSFLYASLLSAMIAGRFVWGMAMLLCMGIRGGSFGFSAFLAGAVFNAFPGILLQLLVIPILVPVLERLQGSRREGKRREPDICIRSEKY